MIPIGLEMSGATREMWGLQDRCSSRTTPRKTVSLTCSILFHLCIFALENDSFSVEDYIKSKESLFALSRENNLLTSEFYEVARWVGSLWDIKKLASSRNKISSACFDTLVKSWIDNKKNEGPANRLISILGSICWENKLLSPDPQCDFFCFTPPTLGTKYQLLVYYFHNCRITRVESRKFLPSWHLSQPSLLVCI